MGRDLPSDIPKTTIVNAGGKWGAQIAETTQANNLPK